MTYVLENGYVLYKKMSKYKKNRNNAQDITKIGIESGTRIHSRIAIAVDSETVNKTNEPSRNDNRVLSPPALRVIDKDYSLNCRTMLDGFNTYT
ncbi:hypothetical protein EVAR_79508_1 [Eumeta japonica]|uniref:Uncharacterized protein n=1 Tax=Eumeta variegata TaxID=151549 RepID=A0A4C1UDZ9_EUMVA|nr:hypothetical protein EVAR_79508_1 [Eumeta japonica]